MSNTLTIAGLNDNYDPKKLEDAVQLFGPCNLIIQEKFAIVTYKSDISAISAQSTLNGTNIIGAFRESVEVYLGNPKTQNWTPTKTTNQSSAEKIQPQIFYGGLSPNFGGYVKAKESVQKSHIIQVNNENINPNYQNQNFNFVSSSNSKSNPTKMNIEPPITKIEKEPAPKKMYENEYLKSQVTKTKKLTNLIESYKRSQGNINYDFEFENSSDQFEYIQEKKLHSFKDDAIILENQRLVYQDLNALSLSDLRELLQKRNIDPIGPKQHLVYLLEKSITL